MKTYFVLVSCLLGINYGAEWSYDYQTQWPGVCKEGTQQSPINIMSNDASVDHLSAHIRGPLQFRGYHNVRVQGKNNGHTLQWDSVDDNPPLLSGGPLRGNYTFAQFHLHWLSEHAIDGMKYAMEIHFVHVKTGLTVAEAVKRADGLAVVGVMCQVAHSKHDIEHSLAEIMSDVSNLREPDPDTTEERTIDLSRMFSPEPQSYYTYHGSLTTPACQEAVTWIVMDKPISISHHQYSLINEVDIHRLDNYRNLQPVNRVVYRSVASCASIFYPTYLILIVSAFNCFTYTMSAFINKGICLLSNTKGKLFGHELKQCFNFIR